MVARAMIFGHDAWYDADIGVWRYDDNDAIVEENPRPCPECDEYRTDENYDPCIGHVPGAISVCCGHGRKQGWIGWPEEE